MDWVELPHGRVRVVVEGPEDGPTVLMIHGLSYPLEAWGPVSRVLVGAGVRTVRCDLYGRGYSGWDGTPLSCAVLAEQHRAMLDHVGIDVPVHLISLSNADLIALWFAQSFPARVLSIALVGPSGLDARTMNFSTRVMGRWPLRCGMAWWMRQRLVRRMRAHAAHMPAQAPSGCADAYAASTEAASSHTVFGPAVVSHLASLPTATALRDTLSAVASTAHAVTALHFGAEGDAARTGVHVLERGLPQLQSESVSDCGHMGMLERPDAVASWWLRHMV
jgi:pimeloyl-ACP methyl ester carboxylesterase